jgi:hypothetical protein
MFSWAVIEGAKALGFTVVQEQTREAQNITNERTVELEIEQSEIVTSQLDRDQQIRVTRAGVTVSFSRDARGKAAICVTGEGYSEEELRAIGEELSGRVVQTYVYQRLLDEMRARQFVVVEEETDENHAIRLKVRHWDP